MFTDEWQGHNIAAPHRTMRFHSTMSPWSPDSDCMRCRAVDGLNERLGVLCYIPSQGEPCSISFPYSTNESEMVISAHLFVLPILHNIMDVTILYSLDKNPFS